MNDREMNSVSLAEVDALRRAELLPNKQYLDAVYFCRDAEFWTRWASRALLALGAGHLLAGIIYFFAYNWDSLSTIAKFAILQGGIVISAVLALVAKLDRPVGEVLLIGATVLVGTLLVVISQVYQTGADAYGLFATWALLVVPWVLASRSAGHWFVWLVIVFVAANLYAFQELVPRGVISTADLSAYLSVGAALILVAREGALRAGMEWLAAGWTRAILAFAVLIIVFPSATTNVLGWDNAAICTVTFVILMLVLAGVYVRLLPDFPVVAICVGFLTLFLMAVGGRVLGEVIGFDLDKWSQTIPSLLFLVLWCTALTTGAVKVLAALRKEIGNGDAND